MMTDAIEKVKSLRLEIEAFLAESRAAEQRIESALSRMHDLEPARVFAGPVFDLAACWD